VRVHFIEYSEHAPGLRGLPTAVDCVTLCDRVMPADRRLAIASLLAQDVAPTEEQAAHVARCDHPPSPAARHPESAADVPPPVAHHVPAPTPVEPSAQGKQQEADMDVDLDNGTAVEAAPSGLTLAQSDYPTHAPRDTSPPADPTATAAAGPSLSLYTAPPVRAAAKRASSGVKLGAVIPTITTAPAKPRKKPAKVGGCNPHRLV
jgi:hypothetical protein